MLLEYIKSGRFIETVIVIIMGIIIIVAADAGDKRYLKTKSSNSKWYRSAKMIIDFINTVIIILLSLLVLSINGVDVGKYFKSLGVIGIILSFALQDILKDVIMGLSIMFEGYFKVGDVVVYNGREAKVVSFNIKTTKLFMTDTEATVSICNRNINEIGISSDWVDIIVPIGYDVDLRRSRNLCRECAKKIERLRHVYSCDFINTQELAESWIEYKLRVHCLPEKKPAVRRNANAVVQDVFYEYNQEFPLSIKVLYNVDPENKNTDIEVDTVKKVKLSDNDVEVMETSTRKKHYDYELGRGAAKSKVCPVDGSDGSIYVAITEAERYSGAENLDKNMKMRIRLLSEELLSFVQGLPNMKNGSFFIERDGGDYEICFDANARISKDARKRLMEVSTTGKNEIYEGISGMLSHAIDSMMCMSINDRSGVSDSSMSTMEESIGRADDNYKWSYNIYKEKEQLSNFDGDTGLDETNIGKSVLTSLSDDIRISVRASHVNIRVLVKNDYE